MVQINNSFKLVTSVLNLKHEFSFVLIVEIFLKKKN